MRNGTDQIALTLTYKTHESINPLIQFQTTIYQVVRLLRKACSKFEIYPECHDNGDIHYHCILTIKDKVKWFKQCLPTFKRNGHVKVKLIFDYDVWEEYCNKDALNMFEVLDMKYKLPITQTFKTKRTRNLTRDEKNALNNITSFYTTI